jgi:Yip1-like protein
VIVRPINVLLDPKNTFMSMAPRPTWVAPLAILMLLATLTSTLTFDKIDVAQAVREQFAAQGRTPDPGQMNRGLTFFENLQGVAALVTLVSFPLVMMLVAFVFWFAFQLAGQEMDYSVCMAVTMHSMMPWAVASLLSVPVILSRDSITQREAMGGTVLASSLGFFAPSDGGPAWAAFLGSVDLFSLWTAILLVIGYRTAAKASTATACSVVFLVWLGYVGIKIGVLAL